MSLTTELDKLLEEGRKNFEIKHNIAKLPHSKCRNCHDDIRLFKGHWFHIFMFASKYHRAQQIECKHALPLRCKKCNGHINYRTTDPSYYDFLCEPCLRTYHGAHNRIGEVTKELRKQLDSASHRYLKYGTVCSVVLTKAGIFFGDIC